MKMKALGQWISIHRWDIFAYSVVGIPLLWLAQFPLYIIWHRYHCHAVAVQFAKAKPNDWKDLAAACQEMIDRYRQKGAEATESQPLPPALRALEPAWTSYREKENQFECSWAGGFDDAILEIRFENGILYLEAGRIPELQFPEAKTQMWPVVPNGSTERQDAK